MTDKNKPCGHFFPQDVNLFEVMKQEKHVCHGIDLRQYAAIHLKVADSGTPWLDEMIEKSRRDEFEKAAMQAFLTDPEVSWPYFNSYDADLIKEVVTNMLAASKGEK